MAARLVDLSRLGAHAGECYAIAFAEQGLEVTSGPPAAAAVMRVAEPIDPQSECSAGARMPVILVGEDASAEAFVAAAAAGAQAYVPSTEPAALAAAVRMVLDTIGVYAAVNPLTGLPGSPALEREIARRLPVRGALAVMQFDLDNFKPYSDVYGYQKGDQMILGLKRLIEAVATSISPAHHFLAHIGGDDFFLTADVASARILGQCVVEKWDAHKADYFSPEHQRAGQFCAMNRRGEPEWFPLTSVTAVMVTNEAPDITHPGQVAAVLAQMKAYAKRMDGSNFVVDRRQDHWGAKGK